MKKNIFKYLLIMGVVILITAANAQTIPAFKSDAEKKTWIKNHPTEYQLLIKQSTANAPVAVPVQNNANFNSTTQSADDEIKALKDEIESNRYNPNYDREHALNKLKNAPAAQRSISIHLGDPSFPAYANTGNPELDKENYKIAKEKWIMNNPEKYQQLQQQQPLPDGQTPEQIRAKELLENN